MNKKEKNKFFIPSRVVALCAFFALAASTAMNLICGVDFGSIIPYEAFVITFVNGLCAFLCFILLFIPTYLPLQLSILFLECVFTTLSGYDILGNFLYVALLLYLFCEGFFKTKIKIKIILLSSFWILILITLSHYGWDRVVYAFVVFIFMVSFFYCLYDMLREQLCFLLPKADINRSKNSVPLPLAGSVLYLSDYGLTKRQIQLINDILETSATYTELGDKYYASTSTIKKDMSRIHKIFGVQNRENLKILLLQYKITQKRY